MQDYLQKTRLSSILDEFGFHLLSLLISILWFVLLWGVHISAITAGMALYCMVVLLRKKIRDDHVVRKEKQLRTAIGGELAMERLLLSSPEQAHFETAMLLSVRFSMVLLQAGKEGILCAWKGKRMLLCFAQIPGKAKLSCEAVLRFQREVKSLHADFGVMCCPCTIAMDARDQGETEPVIHFIARDTMISLFGSAFPATDEQLLQLGKRRKRHLSRPLYPHIFHPRRARRYACYGGLLLLLYLFTHLVYYAVPGLLCVLFAAICRCFHKRRENLNDLFFFEA